VASWCGCAAVVWDAAKGSCCTCLYLVSCCTYLPEPEDIQVRGMLWPVGVDAFGIGFKEGSCCACLCLVSCCTYMPEPEDTQIRRMLWQLVLRMRCCGLGCGKGSCCTYLPEAEDTQVRGMLMLCV
jgi:hypothetical protein